MEPEFPHFDQGFQLFGQEDFGEPSVSADFLEMPPVALDFEDSTEIYTDNAYQAGFGCTRGMMTRWNHQNQIQQPAPSFVCNQSSPAAEFDLFSQDFQQTMRYLDGGEKSPPPRSVSQMLACSLCGLVFPSSSKLERHMMSSHPQAHPTMARLRHSVVPSINEPLMMDLLQNAKEMEHMQRYMHASHSTGSKLI